LRRAAPPGILGVMPPGEAREAGHSHGCGCPGCCPAAPEAPTAETAAATPLAAGGITPAGVDYLQRSVGNAAVAALMRQGAAGDGVLARRILGIWAETDQERYEDAIDDKREYIGEGVKGPEDFQSDTGIGGFNVAYDPAGWELRIILRGSVGFRDGMTLLGGTAVALHPTDAAREAADAINHLGLDQRAAAVAGWKWDDEGKAAFLARFEAVVMNIWSGRHIFHCSRRYWEDMAALPNVSAEVHEGEQGDGDHMAMSVYKVPPAFIGPVGVVRPGGGFLGIGAATDNTMTLNSVDVEERRDDILNVTTSFAAGGTAIDPSQTAAMKQFAIRFRSGGPVCSICGNNIEAVGGVAIQAGIQGEGADPEANAQERFTALVARLVADGMADAATRLQFYYAGEGTDGFLTVGSGVPQIVAAHEAGHMFGLGDRYATTAGAGIGGTGPSVGLPSRHDQLAREGGLGPEGAKAANDDGIMAWGNEVRPADYATFVEALKWISEIDEWALGPPQAVVAPDGTGGPSAPGDYPLPGQSGPDGPAMA
jgi:hypothetical protein